MSESVISRFEIQLDAGDEPTFRGGEVITGKLLIELRQPIILNAIKLQMKGRAVWINDPMKKDDIEKVLFDNDFTLLERPPGKKEPGHFQWISDFTYSLPFECPLPKGCPTSYEGPYAFIRYFIRASLVHEEDSGQFREYFVKKALNLVAPSDGHLIVGETQTVSDSAIFGKCCCKGKLTAELSLPKTGYLPGEDIIGSLKIGNKHPKDILKHMEVRLVDRVRRIGAPEIAEASPWRTLYYKKLEETDTPKAAISREGVHLLTVPPVCPTTKGDFDAATNEVHVLSPFGRLLESPSTATLRFRKQAFIRIEYALQLSLGTLLLLEVPLDIGELSTKSKDTKLTPFVAGPQSIEERDETGKLAVGGPFTYTPMYPYRETAPPQEQLVSKVTIEEPVANGSRVAESVEQREVETVQEENEKTPLLAEETIVTTTKTVFTHVDEHGGTQKMEETVVSKDGETTRTIEETTVDQEGNEEYKMEKTEIDAEGRETVTTEERTIPHTEKEETEIEEEEQPESTEEALEEPGTTEEQPIVTSVNENGEQTVVTTEEIEQDGVKTLRTTTVTKHADGTESTLVQEHSSSTVVVEETQ